MNLNLHAGVKSALSADRTHNDVVHLLDGSPEGDMVGAPHGMPRWESALLKWKRRREETPQSSSYASTNLQGSGDVGFLEKLLCWQPWDRQLVVADGAER